MAELQNYGEEELQRLLEEVRAKKRKAAEKKFVDSQLEKSREVEESKELPDFDEKDAPKTRTIDEDPADLKNIFDKMVASFPCVIVQIGRSKSGKSYNTRYLMYKFMLEYRAFKFGIAWVGSSKLNDDYKFLPEKAVLDYSEDKLKMYLRKLEAMKDKLGHFPPSFMVFDDLLSKLTQSDYFKNFLSIYRHYNITIILCNQYLKDRTSGTLLREQTDFSFTFKTRANNTLTGTYETFGTVFDSYADFKAHFIKCTQKKHTAMFYIQDEDEIENNYLSYAAPPNLPNKKIHY